MRLKNSNFINQSGSALLAVLVLSASAVVTALILLQSSAQTNELYARKALSGMADNAAQTLGSIIMEPSVCINGFTATGPGMKFLPSGRFNVSMAASTNGQDVSIPNPSAPGSSLAAGSSVPGTSLSIIRLYVTAPTPTSAGATDYTVTLNASFSTGAGGPGLAPRVIYKLKVTTDGTGLVLGCGPAPSAVSNQSLCEGMGCDYSTSSSGQGTCHCPIPPVTCTGGTYVQSIVSNVPVCSSTTVSRTCAPAGYMVALDGNGQAVCATVTSCPSGTATNGLGAPANPPTCKCFANGSTWNGTSCDPPPVPVIGLCGTPPNAGTFATAAAANSAGPLCSAGTASPAVLAGAGPWSWTCLGTTGINASCSASTASGPSCVGGASTTVTANPASPAGCYCPVGQTWSAGTSTCNSTSAPLCPDGVTVAHQSWSGVAPATGSPACTYPTGFTGGVGWLDSCSHVAINSSCDSGGTHYICLSSCPSGPSCVGGATTTVSANAAAPAGCYCQGGTTWNAGTSTCVSASCLADGERSPNFWATGQDDALCSSSMPIAPSADTACCSGTSYPGWGIGDNIGSGGCPNICGPPTSSPIGVCGSSNGISSSSQPTGTAACAGGTIINMSGSGPWTWRCSGSTQTVNCSAPAQGAVCASGWRGVNNYSAPTSQANLGSGSAVVEQAWDFWRVAQGASAIGAGNTFSSTFAQQADGSYATIYSGQPNGNVTGTFNSGSPNYPCTTDRAGYYALHAVKQFTGASPVTFQIIYQCTCP